jgi:hypothetical protein
VPERKEVEMSLRKAAEMALEALKQAKDRVADWGAYASNYFQTKNDLQGDLDEIQAQITALRQALAQPEQEPIGWMTPSGEGFRFRFEPPTNDVPLGWTPIYTAPPKREWKCKHCGETND